MVNISNPMQAASAYSNAAKAVTSSCETDTSGTGSTGGTGSGMYTQTRDMMSKTIDMLR